MKRILLLFLFLLPFLGASPAWAENYFLSPTGSNSNDGRSSAFPKLTPQGLEQAYVMGPGDIVELAEGTYTNSWAIAEGGSLGNPVIYRPAAAAAVLVEGSASGAKVFVSAPYVKLEKGSGASFTIHNTNVTASVGHCLEFDRGATSAVGLLGGGEANGLIITGGTGHGIIIERHPDARIVNCTITAAVGSGIFANVLDSGTGAGIDSPNLYAYGNVISHTTSHAIYTETSSAWIEANNTSYVDELDVHGNNAHGMYLKGVLTRVFGNTSHHNISNGIVLRSTGIAYNNLCHTNGGYGVSFFNDGAYTLYGFGSPPKTIDIYNNVTYGNTLGGLNASGDSSSAGWSITIRHNTCDEPNVGLGFENLNGSPPAVVRVANNIFNVTGTDASDKVINGRANSPDDLIETNNVHRISGSVTSPYAWDASASNFATWQTAASAGASDAGVNRSTVDPVFTNSGSHIYTLQQSSTLIGLGSAAYLEALDFAGVTRVTPGTIGAYELVLVVTPGDGDPEDPDPPVDIDPGPGPGPERDIRFLETEKIVWRWTSNADGNTSVTTSFRVNGKIESYVSLPGTGGAAPAAARDERITDNEGVDLLWGAGTDLSATLQTSKGETLVGMIFDSRLTFWVAGAGDSNTGTIILKIRKRH